jgi:hypothetical protein
MQRLKGKCIVKVVFGYDTQIYEVTGTPVQGTRKKRGDSPRAFLRRWAS